MTILHHQKKGKKPNTIEQYHIYRTTKTGKQLNELYTEKYNAIFETIMKIYPFTHPQRPPRTPPPLPHPDTRIAG
jgi:hypothetical protein